MPNESLGQLTAQLGADIHQMRQAMDRAEKMVKDYERTTDSRLDKSENRWRMYGRRVRGYAQGMKASIFSLQSAMAGMAGALIIGDTIRKAAQYEQTMAEVKGITQATAQEFQALSEISRKMGETTEWSASQAGGGLKFLSMAGFEANQSVEALPGVLDLATAGNIELGRAADIASNALTAMRLPVRQLSRVNDTFVKTITSSNTNMEMLAESFKYAGSIGAAFGYEVEEISALIGQLGNAGIQGSMAGTQLAMAFQKTEEVFEEYNKQGVKTTEYTKDLFGAMKLLEDQGASASEVMDIFGQRAGRGVAALLGIGTDAIDEYRGSIKDAEGATKDLASTMRDTTIGRFRELKSVIESVQIDMFRRQSGSLNETLEDMAGYIRENKDAIIDFADSAVEALKTFTPIAKAAGSFIKDSMDAWNRAPEVVQTLGIIGALMFGKKGLAALAGISWMGKNLGKMIAEDLYGEIDVKERLTSQLEDLGKEAQNIRRKILDLERLKAGETAGHFGTKQKEALEKWRNELSRVEQQIEQTYSTLEYMNKEQEKKQQDAWKTEFAEKYKQTIDEVPAGIGRTVEELKKLHAEQEKQENQQKKNVEEAKKQEEIFQKLRNSLKEQYKQLTMTNDQWEVYQALQKLGKDATKEHRNEIRKQVEELQDMRELQRQAEEWDKQGRMAPAGIGPGYSQKELEESKNRLDKLEEKSKDTFDQMANAFDGWANRYSSQLNDMLWESELTFDGILESFGKMLTEMMIQSAMSDVTGALFGESGGGEGEGLLKMGANAALSYFGGMMHEGGTVGKDGTPFMASASMWAGAPRLHNGLKPDEFPAVLQRGEQVIPKDKAKGGGQPVQNNNFNITVQAPEGNLSKQSQRQLRRQLTRSVSAANRGM